MSKYSRKSQYIMHTPDCKVFLPEYSFGNDYHALVTHKATAISKDPDRPYYSDTRALVFPHPVPGSRGMSAALLNKLHALVAAGWSGIPYDIEVDGWMRRHQVEEVTRDGKIAVRKWWRLFIEHAGAEHLAVVEAIG